MYYQYYKIELNGKEDELHANLKMRLLFSLEQFQILELSSTSQLIN